MVYSFPCSIYNSNRFSHDKVPFSGWIHEPKYTINVLVGNWYEDKVKIIPTNAESKSMYQQDFENYFPFSSDKRSRIKSSLRDYGLPNSQLFTHPSFHKLYSHSQNTTYLNDFHLNFAKNDIAPLSLLRSWNRHSLSWQPERTNSSCNTLPINYGLHDNLKKKWTNNDLILPLNYTSTSSDSYGKFDQKYYQNNKQAFPAHNHHKSI